MDSLLNALIKNTKLAIIIIGLFLMLMGASGGFSKLSLTVAGPAWKVALFIMGVIVAGFGALLIWRTGHEIGETDSSIYDCALRITFPLEEAGLQGNVKIKGTFQKLPPRDRIWVLERSLTTGLYYFNSRPIFEDENKRWYAEYTVGGEPGSERVLQIVAVGNAGKALAEYYFKVIKDTGRRVGIEAITADIVPLHSIKVKHS